MTTPIVPAQAPAPTAGWRITPLALLPYVLAAVFVLTSLRGISGGSTFFPDAARHAMNGVLIHDMVRSGSLARPVAFARSYYNRWPVISLPYHPPLFPTIEALFYGVFGLNLFAARLPVVIAAGACVLLLYRLVLRTHGSALLATLAAGTFAILPIAQMVATDVMLEMPALAFALGALSCLEGFPASTSLRRWAGFTVLAVAAVWTKQHTVFLGLVPFWLIVLGGHWAVLSRPGIWMASITLGVAALALLKLSGLAQGAGGMNQFAPLDEAGNIFLHNLSYYARILWGTITPVGALAAIGTLAACLTVPRLRRRRELHLYVAWFLGLVALLLATGQYNSRYLFFGLPAALVLAYSGADLIGRWLAGRYAVAVPCLLAAGLLIVLVPKAARIDVALRGPAQVAETLHDLGARRILYYGRYHGDAALALRFLAGPDRAVVRGDKLDPSVLEPDALAKLLYRYGFDALVAVREFDAPRDSSNDPEVAAWYRLAESWRGLPDAPPAGVVLERTIPVVTWPGRVERAVVYVFANQRKSPNPERYLEVPIAKAGGHYTLDLGEASPGPAAEAPGPVPAGRD